MTASQTVSSAPGTRKAKVQIALIGTGIAVVWIVIASYCVTARDQHGNPLARLALQPGEPGIATPLQLVMYSFIHGSPDGLPVQPPINIFLLALLTALCPMTISPLSYVRLYSLGGLLAGAAYLAMSWATGNTRALAGAHPVLMAMWGAIMVMGPRIEGSKGHRAYVRFLLIVMGLLMFGLPLGHTREVRDQPPTLMAMVAGLGAGVAYGFVEKWWQARGGRAGTH